MVTKLRYSEAFKGLLKQIQQKNDILTLLMSVQDVAFDTDITCIDLPKNSEKQDYESIQFRSISGLKKLFNQKYKVIYKNDFEAFVDDISRGYKNPDYKQRTCLEEKDFEAGKGTMKISRLLTRLINIYQNKSDFDKIPMPLIKKIRSVDANGGSISITNMSYIHTELNHFINIYKSCTLKRHYYFEEVTGNDIKKCYYYKNSVVAPHTALNMSCMRGRKCQKYLKIYTDNPQVCRLLVLRYKDMSDKVAGRALLWKLTDGRTMMDVVYTISEHDYMSFMEYAKAHNYVHRNHARNIEVKIENKHIKGKGLYYFFKSKYPFMDTLKYYNHYDNILSDEFSGSRANWIMLRSTSGGYQFC